MLKIIHEKLKKLIESSEFFNFIKVISQFPINFSKILLHSVDFQRIQMAQVARLLCCEVDST